MLRQCCALKLGSPDFVEMRQRALKASGGPPDEYDMEYEEAVVRYENWCDEGDEGDEGDECDLGDGYDYGSDGPPYEKWDET
jgi:hypothetical protein